MTWINGALIIFIAGQLILGSGCAQKEEKDLSMRTNPRRTPILKVHAKKKVWTEPKDSNVRVELTNDSNERIYIPAIVKFSLRHPSNFRLGLDASFNLRKQYGLNEVVSTTGKRFYLRKDSYKLDCADDKIEFPEESLFNGEPNNNPGKLVLEPGSAIKIATEASELCWVRNSASEKMRSNLFGLTHSEEFWLHIEINNTKSELLKIKLEPIDAFADRF